MSITGRSSAMEGDSAPLTKTCASTQFSSRPRPLAVFGHLKRLHRKSTQALDKRCLLMSNDAFVVARRPPSTLGGPPPCEISRAFCAQCWTSGVYQSGSACLETTPTSTSSGSRSVLPSRIPSLCPRSTHAGIEWCCCHRAVCMV